MRTLTAVLLIACLSFRLWSNRQHERDITAVMQTALIMDECIKAMRRRAAVRAEIKRDECRIDELKAELSTNWRAA